VNYELCMENNTKSTILAYIKEKGAVAPKDLKSITNIGPRAIFKQLKNLINKGILAKTGQPPKVYYRLAESDIPSPSPAIPLQNTDILEQNYLIITPQGQAKTGVDGFLYWCKKNQLDPNKAFEDYKNTLAKYNRFKKDGLIDGLPKFKQTFPTVYLDEIYYLDFYSLERFGKTKLGWLLLYAKQTQNLELMKQIYELIKEPIQKIISAKKIKAVGFIPPTIARQLQLQKELEKMLNLGLPKINLIKIANQIAVPQKSLNKLEDRIENASHTIMIDDKNIYDNILLIDDAVGSGATLNETARQIKNKKLCSGKIIGLALTGSFKGFDIINEV